MILKHRNYSWTLVVTRGHSWSFVVTRGHSWSLVDTRGHSWSLVCTFRQDLQLLHWSVLYIVYIIHWPGFQVFLTYRKGAPTPHVSPPFTYFAPTSENHFFKRYWQKMKNNLVQDNVFAVFSLFCIPTLLNVIPLILFVEHENGWTRQL